MRTQQMDILRLLDELSKQIELTPHIGPITWGLNRDEISMQIAKVRASLPQELKAAVSTVRESERIIDTAKEDANSTLERAQSEAQRVREQAQVDADRMKQQAQTEADRILEQAKAQQERMVSESEILKLSKAQSEELRNAAERDAMNMKRGAEKYAHDVLGQLEGVVGKVMTTIERGKGELNRPDPSQALPPSGRDRLRAG